MTREGYPIAFSLRAVAVAAVVVATVMAGAAPAQAISRKRADAIALKVLRPERVKAPNALLGLPRALPAGSRVVEGGIGLTAGKVTKLSGGRIRARVKVTRLKGRAWLYWHDLARGAAFQHPSEILVVDDRTGRVLRRQAMTWWPLVNGKRPAFLGSVRARHDRRYRVFDDAPPARGTAGRVALAAPRITGPPALPNDCIVVLGDRTDPLFANTFRDIAQTAQLLGVRRADARSAAELDAKIRELEAADPPCTDVVVWVAAHGYPPTGASYKHPTASGNIPESRFPQVALSESVTDIYGNTTVTQTLFDGQMLRGVLAGHRDITFKLIVDACFSGRWTELMDEPNLRITLTAARRDQMGWGWFPGDYYAASQTNAVVTTTGTLIPNQTSNPNQAQGFTNGLDRGLVRWSGSDDAQAVTGLDLGAALKFAYGSVQMHDMGAITGMSVPQIADMTAERPHAAPPSAGPPGGGGAQTSYSVTIGLSYRHGPPAGPGGAPSEVCVRVRTSPARTGKARVRLTGPGVASGGDQTLDLEADGTALARVGINQYGDYTAGADVTAAGGAERSGAGQITVTSAPGTCAAP